MNEKIVKLHTDNQAPTLDGRTKDSRMLVTLTLVELKDLIREAVREEISQNGHHEGDKLLTAKKAAEFLSVEKDWLYKHQKKLPFSRKLGPKMLRFSYQGIQKYLATRKNA